MHDKKLYWANRKAGKRGQGPEHNAVGGGVHSRGPINLGINEAKRQIKAASGLRKRGGKFLEDKVETWRDFIKMVKFTERKK